MGKTIDGRAYAKALKGEMKEQIEKNMKKSIRIPKLVTILIGNDGGSIYYVNNQKKVCEEVGVEFKLIHFEENIEEKELLNTINILNEDMAVDGIMLQVPLPKHLNQDLITNSIHPRKDVDGLTDYNNGKFYKGEESFVPCTPRSVIQLIKSVEKTIKGKRAVVLGRSNIVGKPVANLLLKEDATVTICHSKSENLKDLCKEADILVSAIGRPNFVDSTFVKEGAIVIDVGTSSVNNKICGDVNYEEVLPKASAITPVPGGVGALTTTLLIKNTCEAWEKNVR